MNGRNFLRALWANKIILLGILALYCGLVSLAYALRSERPKVPPVDVVFVFDTTGSMQDDIDGLLRISSHFANKLSSTGSDYRIGMVTFGAREEAKVIRRTFKLSNNLRGFQDFLRNTHAEGGGSEDQPTAMKHAMTQFAYRPQAHKILILVTDEPLLGEERIGVCPAPNADWNEIIQKLVKTKFTACAVCLPEECYKALAHQTGGKFYDITGHRDFTDIVMEIAQDINASLTK